MPDHIPTRAETTAQDYQSAREYLWRAVGDHSSVSVEEWEEAVAKCAAVTARLRRAAVRHRAILEKLGDE